MYTVHVNILNTFCFIVYLADIVHGSFLHWYQNNHRIAIEPLKELENHMSAKYDNITI